MANEQIQVKRVRDSLAVRPYEPYWRTIERGRAIGFRKVEGTDSGSYRGYWLARMRPEDGGAKYDYETLGEASATFGWDQAKTAAEAWFLLRAQGVKTGDVETVADACRAYVTNRRASKSEACAHDADLRFERTVYPTAFGDQKLAKVNAERVREWRDSLKLKPGATNRTLTALKAALNLAVKRKDVSAALTGELRLVEPKPREQGKSSRRELYLTLAQRRVLLKAAADVSAAARDLLEAAALTGARAGELTRASVSQLNLRERTIRFYSGKQHSAKRDGWRNFMLSPAAVRLFKRLAEGKAGDARLFLRDDGQPWAHSDWDGPIREAAKAAKLPAEPHTGVCAYTLRHCWITDTLLAGMSVFEVAKLAGTSVQMIQDHYGHLVAGAARAKLAKVRLA